MPCDGKLVAAGSESQDVAVVGLELQHHSSVSHQLEASKPPWQTEFLPVNHCLLKQLHGQQKNISYTHV